MREWYSLLSSEPNTILLPLVYQVQKVSTQDIIFYISIQYSTLFVKVPDALLCFLTKVQKVITTTNLPDDLLGASLDSMVKSKRQSNSFECKMDIADSTH
jgi:hypothetical protein